MSKIEKHGIPTFNTVGEKGDTYVDLDTGIEYMCHGTRGFIDIDSVDEPVQYKWERAKSSNILEFLVPENTVKDNGDIMLPVVFNNEVVLEILMDKWSGSDVGGIGNAYINDETFNTLVKLFEKSDAVRIYMTMTKQVYYTNPLAYVSATSLQFTIPVGSNPLKLAFWAD